MGFYGAVRAALAKNRHVICPRFLKMEFDSVTMRVWEGVGDIVVDGQTWSGLATLLSISDSPIGADDEASSVTYTLSGVDSNIITAAQRTADEVRGRPITLLASFLDRDTFAPLDDMFLLRLDTMDRIEYSGSGPKDRSASLVCESIWTNRVGSAFATYSVKDQQQRFASDVGTAFLTRLTAQAKRKWPTY